MRHLAILSTLFLLTFFSAFARAGVLNGYGTSASTGTASNCPSFCTSANGGDFQSDSAGGEFASASSASEGTYGTASAQARMTGSSYLPDLKVFSSSKVGKGADATAFAIQGFTFDGTKERAIDLSINLHGVVADGGSGYTSNSVGASVAVLKGSRLDWYSSFGTLVFETAPATTTRLALENLSLSADSPKSDTSTTVSFNIAPGDDFYVVASMSASARNGSADALNTLTLQFDTDEGLTASLIPVPEPSTGVFFGLAFLLIARRRFGPFTNA